MNSDKPLIIAVAPNGARLNKNDHPALPLTPGELADTAVSCKEAGAQMIHLHVRDDKQQHTISPKYYLPALNAVKQAVGDEMLIQVTSEAAGIFTADEQMRMMLQLMPDCMSIALRELLPEGTDIHNLQQFIQKLDNAGCLLQYILYDFADFKLYQSLIEKTVIQPKNHSILLVLGRYQDTFPTIDIVDSYRDLLMLDTPLMVCAFGPHGQQILSKSIDLGCHVRVGFENGLLLPDGIIASTNAELVAKSLQSFTRSGRPVAGIEQTRELLGQSN